MSLTRMTIIGITLIGLVAALIAGVMRNTADVLIVMLPLAIIMAVTAFTTPRPPRNK